MMTNLQAVKAVTRWPAIALVALAVLFTLAGGAAVRAEPASSPVKQASFDTVVRDGRLQFAVGRQWCGVYDLGEGSRTYCPAALIVKNIGRDSVIFYDSRQRGYADGRWVTPDTAAGYAGNMGAGAPWLQPIAPGAEMVCTIVFRHRVERLLLRDTWLSSGVTVTVPL